jgi:hypothetical protein
MAPARMDRTVVFPVTNNVVCLPHRWNLPPRAMNLEPQSLPSLSLGEHHRRHFPPSIFFVPHRPLALTELQDLLDITAGCHTIVTTAEHRRAGRLPPPHRRFVTSVRTPPGNLAPHLSRIPLMLTSLTPPPLADRVATGEHAYAGAPHTVTVPVRSCRSHAARPAWPLWQPGWAG